MAGSSVAESTIQVTLLQSKSTGRVLYLEAGKDFVDILLSFLTLPVGAVIKFLSEGANVKSMGGIANIFESVKKLDKSVLYVDKRMLVNPGPATGFRPSNLLRINANQENLYMCPERCSFEISTIQNYECRHCYKYDRINDQPVMSVPVTIQPPAGAPAVARMKKEGYLKKNLTYIVTDTLEITLTSTIKTIDILNEMKIEKMSDLQSYTIPVDASQILQLLRASLGSNSALNDVFGKTPPEESVLMPTAS